MAALRGRDGKAQARRAGADHGNALFCSDRGDHQFRLVAGAGVDQAACDLAAEGVVQAGLVAGDAGVDLVGPALARLAHEVGISQQRPRHGDHVGTAFGQQALGHLGRVDAVGGDERYAHLPHDLLRHPRIRRTRHLGSDGGNARLVPADAGVQDGGARCLDGLGELYHLGQRGAALHQVEHGQAVDDDEVRTHPLARAPHDLDRETHAVGIAAAPVVVALVAARGNELVDQVALGAHDFHPVIARVLGQRGAAREVFDGLLHLVGRERVRHMGVDGCAQRARGHQVAVVGIAAEVQNLHRDLAALGMHCLGHLAVLLGLVLVDQHGPALHGPAALVGCDAARDDESHLAARPLGIEGRHAFEAVGHLLQPHVHGAHEHAVLQRGEAQVQRGMQVRVGAAAAGQRSRSGFENSTHRGSPLCLCNQLHKYSPTTSFVQLVA